jgi:predicted NAD/FAD-dependent oxidoreductase
MSILPPLVAVIGAGLAGATCAQVLHEGGWAVRLFDKARGPGGRLATRRSSLLGADGVEQAVALDHGCIGFAARSPAFQAFCATLPRWRPRPAPHSAPLGEHAELIVPAPGLPSLCRSLIAGLPLHTGHAVQRLVREAGGWRIDDGPEHYDAVLLAIPPAQALPLLAGHRDDWAQRAALAPMQPCWTLFGVALAEAGDASWDLLRPTQGPLAWVMRNDSRPGRDPAAAGDAHWVVHAKPGWSREHLELAPDTAAVLLDAALADALGHPLVWRQRQVHRWRYALPIEPLAQAQAWWDASLGLGVAGDFLGGAGAEGAWLSGRALAAAVLQQDFSPQVPAALLDPAAPPMFHGAPV